MAPNSEPSVHAEFVVYAMTDSRCSELVFIQVEGPHACATAKQKLQQGWSRFEAAPCLAFDLLVNIYNRGHTYSAFQNYQRLVLWGPLVKHLHLLVMTGFFSSTSSSVGAANPRTLLGAWCLLRSGGSYPKECPQHYTPCGDSPLALHTLPSQPDTR